MTGGFTELLNAKIFEQKHDGSIDDLHIQLAAAVLMFEVIKADGDIDKMEVAEMVDILRTNFALRSDEIRSLLKSARNATDEELNIESFTKRICDSWGARERTRLLKDFWVIALADNQLDPYECETIDKIAHLLKLDEDEITRARYHAEQKIELDID